MKGSLFGRFGGFLERFGHRISTIGYTLKNPSYANVRRSGGARDLYRVLNKPWLPQESVGTVLDVGANEGQFIKTARALFPKAPILAFEPNPRVIQNLQGLLLRREDAVLQVACGRESASGSLHLTTFGPSSSLLQPTSLRITGFPLVEAKESLDVQVERLDRLVAEHASAPKPYLLKIDVQGFELEVLQGATGILSDVVAILCEVNLVPFYKGQASFEDVYGFMRQYDFKLADIGEPIRAPDNEEILYADVAFLNTHRAANSHRYR